MMIATNKTMQTAIMRMRPPVWIRAKEGATITKAQALLIARPIPAHKAGRLVFGAMSMKLAVK